MIKTGMPLEPLWFHNHHKQQQGAQPHAQHQKTIRHTNTHAPENRQVHTPSSTRLWGCDCLQMYRGISPSMDTTSSPICKAAAAWQGGEKAASAKLQTTQTAHLDAPVGEHKVPHISAGHHDCCNDACEHQLRRDDAVHCRQSEGRGQQSSSGSVPADADAHQTPNKALPFFTNPQRSDASRPSCPG